MSRCCCRSTARMARHRRRITRRRQRRSPSLAIHSLIPQTRNGARPACSSTGLVTIFRYPTTQTGILAQETTRSRRGCIWRIHLARRSWFKLVRTQERPPVLFGTSKTESLLSSKTTPNIKHRPRQYRHRHGRMSRGRATAEPFLSSPAGRAPIQRQYQEAFCPHRRPISAQILTVAHRVYSDLSSAARLMTSESPKVSAAILTLPILSLPRLLPSARM